MKQLEQDPILGPIARRMKPAEIQWKSYVQPIQIRMDSMRSWKRITRAGKRKWKDYGRPVPGGCTFGDAILWSMQQGIRRQIRSLETPTWTPTRRR